MMCCRSDVDKSVLSGSPDLLHRLTWNCLPLTSEVHCCSQLVVMRRDHLLVWLPNALFKEVPPYAAVLTCVECLLEVNGCGLVSRGGALSELLECVHVVRREVAWSEACMVDRLGVWCGVQTSEEELAEQDLDRTDGSIVGRR